MTKKRIVIQMDGGLIRTIHSEEPLECLIVDEAMDSAEDELLKMYPDKVAVYANTREVETNSNEVAGQFLAYHSALEKRHG